MEQDMSIIWKISDLQDEVCKLGDAYNLASESLEILKKLNEDSPRYGKLITLLEQVIEENGKQHDDIYNEIEHLFNQLD